MKVLIAHNAYQHAGGEDSVVDSEVAMLRSRGDEVVEYHRRNDELEGTPRGQLAIDALWSRRTVADVRALLRQHRPDVMHVHNTMPLISPSVYWAASEGKVPVVQTLHNFRLLCPQAMLLRDGHICEDCVGRTPWPGIVHACYRGSRAQTAVVAATVTLHRGLSTWAKKVHRYIALNEFCRGKFIEGGLPAERISIKPNFVDSPSIARDAVSRQGLLFVGRLSPEKGIAALAKAAERLPSAALRVAGTGPSAGLLDGLAAVVTLGALSQPQVTQEMRSAMALVIPSIWYENFPRTLVEAFAAGLPVLASRVGALADIVEDGVTGLHFTPNDPSDLAGKMVWALNHPDEMAVMGSAARAVYEAQYTPTVNYQQLLQIYREAIEQHADPAMA